MVKRIVAALALTLATLGIATPAAAEDDSLQIVQLGDSYSSGNGAGSYSERECFRSPLNYGQRVATAIGADYTNVACGGAVNSHITDSAQYLGWQKSITKLYRIPRATYPDQSAEWQRRVEAANLCGATPGENMSWEYRRVAPAPAGNLYTATLECHLYNDPQINAVSDKTDLVFLTIGGNDAGFAELVANCLVVKSERACRNSVAKGARTLNEDLGPRLARTLAAIDQASQGNATVYLLGYPDLLKDESFVIGAARYVGSSSSSSVPGYDFGAQLRDFQADYDQISRDVIEGVDAGRGQYHFVDVKPAFAGHGYDPDGGLYQPRSWLIPPLRGFIPGEWMHPKVAGWEAEANILLEAMGR